MLKSSAKLLDVGLQPSSPSRAGGTTWCHLSHLTASLKRCLGWKKKENLPWQVEKKRKNLIFKPGRHHGGDVILSPSQSHSDKEGKKEITILIETLEKDWGDIAPQHNCPRWIAARMQPDIRSRSSCAASLRLKNSHGI